MLVRRAALRNQSADSYALCVFSVLAERVFRVTSRWEDEMTSLDEIKEVALSSAQRAERAMQYLPSVPSEKDLSQFQDIVLDLRADLLAYYKVCVLEVRRADEPEQIAAIWKKALALFDTILAAWGHLRGFDPVTQSVLDDYRKTLERLKATVTEHYKFHAEE
jgi:hypothetical protein